MNVVQKCAYAMLFIGGMLFSDHAVGVSSFRTAVYELRAPLLLSALAVAAVCDRPAGSRNWAVNHKLACAGIVYLTFCADHGLKFLEAFIRNNRKPR